MSIMPLSISIGFKRKIEHVWLMVLKDFTIKIIMVGIMTLETGPSIGGHNLICLFLEWLPNNCGLSKTHIEGKMEIPPNKICTKILLVLQT